MDNMKPCPFCGGEASEGKAKINGIERDDIGWVGCTHCTTMAYTHGEYGKKKAIEAWNSRTCPNLSDDGVKQPCVEWPCPTSGMINFKTTQCADICHANRVLDTDAGEWNCKNDCHLRLLIEKQTVKPPAYRMDAQFPHLGPGHYCECGVRFEWWNRPEGQTRYCGNCGQRLK